MRELEDDERESGGLWDGVGRMAQSSNRRTGLLTGVVGMGDEMWCSVLTCAGAILTKLVYHASQRLDLPCGAQPGTFWLGTVSADFVSLGVKLAVEVRGLAPCSAV